MYTLRLPSDAATDLNTCQTLAERKAAALPPGFEVLLARVSASLGRTDRARTLLAQVIARAEEQADQETMAVAQLELATLLTLGQRPAEALSLTRSALTAAERIGDPKLVAAALVSRANGLLAAGVSGDTFIETSRLLDRVEAQIARTASPSAQAELRLAYAETALNLRNAWPQQPVARGWLEAIYRALRAVAEGAKEAGDRRSLSQALQLLSRLYESEGASEQALSLAQDARRLAEEVGDGGLSGHQPADHRDVVADGRPAVYNSNRRFARRQPLRRPALCHGGRPEP